MKPEEYLLVESRVAQERANLNMVLDDMTKLGLYPQLSSRSIGGFDLTDREAVRILGSFLQDFYTFVENIAKAVASRVDKSVPKGDDWHRELLIQASIQVPGVRPAVFSSETRAALDPYRGFRHVFRNAYGFQIDSARAQTLIRELPRVVAGIERDLHRFTDEMRRVLDLPVQLGESSRIT